MRILINYLILSFCLLPAIGCSKEVNMKVIAETTPVSVASITTCGAWQDKTESGYMKFIHIDHPEQSGYFLQKIKVNFEDKVPTLMLVDVFDIKELNNDLLDFSLENVECEENKLFVYGESLTSNKKYEFQMTFSEIGEYKIIKKQAVKKSNE